jgi:hypothetical protein
MKKSGPMHKHFLSIVRRKLAQSSGRREGPLHVNVIQSGKAKSFHSFTQIHSAKLMMV